MKADDVVNKWDYHHYEAKPRNPMIVEHYPRIRWVGLLGWSDIALGHRCLQRNKGVQKWIMQKTYGHENLWPVNLDQFNTANMTPRQVLDAKAVIEMKFLAGMYPEGMEP